MSHQQTIAVLGASNDRRKFGNKSVRAHVDEGWQVFPINLKESQIEGLEAYARLADVPADLDRVSVYLPPVITYRLLDEIAEKGAGDVYFNPGSEDGRVLDRARELGISAVAACSIVAIGRSPAQYP